MSGTEIIKPTIHNKRHGTVNKVFCGFKLSVYENLLSLNDTFTKQFLY